jgi:hypothetical protein
MLLLIHPAGTFGRIKSHSRARRGGNPLFNALDVCNVVNRCPNFNEERGS